MAAGTGTWPGTSGIPAGKSETGKSEMGKAARLRRLWRSQDARVQASGLARARPAPAPPARDDGPGSRGLTARELINMARAARAGSDPLPQG